MTKKTMLYLVRTGYAPKMYEMILVHELPIGFKVKRDEDCRAFLVYKEHLARQLTLATTDRKEAVTALLVALREAKARSERRIDKINIAINEVITKEGL